MSLVTFGRDSYTTPTTPSGTRRFEMARPFGRVILSNCSPTGSARLATASTSRAIPATRSEVRRRRSISIRGDAFAQSCAFAARISRLAHAYRVRNRQQRPILEIGRCLCEHDRRGFCARGFVDQFVYRDRHFDSPNPCIYSITTIIPMDYFVAEVVPENGRNLCRPASSDPLEIGGAVVRHTASHRLAFGPDDVDAVAAVEGTLHVDQSCGQQRAPASQRRHRPGIDMRGRLPGEPCEDPSLAAFHPRAIRRKSRADRLPFDGPYKDIVGRSACHQYGHAGFGREAGGLQLGHHSAGAARGACARCQREDFIRDDRDFSESALPSSGAADRPCTAPPDRSAGSADRHRSGSPPMPTDCRCRRS